MTDTTGHASEAHGDHGGMGKYLAVFVALCVLTGASFFTYSSLWPFHRTPAVGWSFMMAVSCTKAALVMLFFMHLKWEANWKYVLTIPPAIMAIFIMLALVPDIGLRYRLASPERRAAAGAELEFEHEVDPGHVDYEEGAGAHGEGH